MITDSERRLICQLGIPRNIDDIYTQVRGDRFAPYGPTQGGVTEVESEVERLAKAGLVVALGEHRDDLAGLAASLERQDVVPLADEQLETWTRRLAVPSREWRAIGDLYLLSAEGLEALKESPVDSAPLTSAELTDVVRREHARIALEPAGSLADKLLADEFASWLDGVLAEHERVWGEAEAERVRRQVPVSGGAGWSDVFEARILDQENQKTQMPALVAPWYMALSILAFNDTDTGTTADDGSHIPTYTGYARKSVAAADMNAASGGSAANANPITFAACTGGSSSIVAFANTSAATVGELRKYGTCTSTTVSTTQTPATFNAGAYTTTAD